MMVSTRGPAKRMCATQQDDDQEQAQQIDWGAALESGTLAIGLEGCR
jgi:hypothetical protein